MDVRAMNESKRHKGLPFVGWATRTIPDYEAMGQFQQRMQSSPSPQIDEPNLAS